MRIGSHETDERVLVVAEIGNNHEGDAGTARELVRAAAAAGADAVKFQTFAADRLVGPEDEVRLAQLRRFQLPPDEFAELAALAREHGLGFTSTPLDLESVDVLEPLVDALKIASGDNDFLSLLERVADAGKPVIISGGLVGVPELQRAVDVVRARWGAADHGLAVLHCVAAYPPAPEELNLRAIPLLARELGCTIGYSDHVPGTDAAVAAVALGARIVEKHFTLDKAQSAFRDHALSADPRELAELVGRIRAVEPMLGEPRKEIQPSEEPVAASARRSAVAARALRAGETLAADDVLWLRPAGAIGADQLDDVVGRLVARDVPAGTRLAHGDLV